MLFASKSLFLRCQLCHRQAAGDELRNDRQRHTEGNDEANLKHRPEPGSKLLQRAHRRSWLAVLLVLILLRTAQRSPLGCLPAPPQPLKAFS